MKIFKNTATAAPEILLPQSKIDLSKWSVIACDQYTSESEYWKNVNSVVGDSPSSLRLILPEVYLNTENEDSIARRLSDISSTVENYLRSDTWNKTDEGFIVLNRSTPLHPSRKGLVLAVDLEQYSFKPGNRQKIRATEGTVLSRIPPRVKIRAGSPVELPHVMLLIDDPMNTVIENAWNKCTAEKLSPVYDAELMLNSGHITGYFLKSGTSVFEETVKALGKLAEDSNDGLVFAVGDGNHSLASAKAYWESVRDNLSPEERENHPARFALAEAVNIHDTGLDFEPIHRLVFGIGRNELIKYAEDYFSGSADPEACSCNEQQAVLVCEGEDDIMMRIPRPVHSLTVGSVQNMLDSLNLKIDYIHGENSVRTLSDKNNTGIILPPISKDSFFRTIISDGLFPRKTFSMGEAFEKRFYLEAKKIRS